MRACVFACAVACTLVMSACSKQPQPRQLSQAQPVTHAILQPTASQGPQPTATTPTPAISAPATQPQADTQATLKVVASEHTDGPFRIGDQSFTFVKHVLSIEGSKSPDDSSVDWWELRDGTGKSVYRQQHPVNFQNGIFAETEDVSARQLKASFGQGIQVDGGELPSAPNSGWWVQVFALINGKLAPLDPPMRADGSFLGEDVTSYQPTPTGAANAEHIA